MSPGAIRCTFEITFDEFREGVLAIQQANVRRQQAKNTRKPGGFLVVLATITFAILFAMIMGFGFRLEQFEEIRPRHYVLFTLIIPGVVIMTVVLALARRQRVKLIDSREGLLKRAVGRVIAIAPFAVLAGMVMLSWAPHFGERDEATGRLARDWYGTLFPHAAWALYVGIIFAISARASRRQIEQLWEMQPSLTRQRTIDFSEAGVAVDEKVAARRYTWPSLVRLIETERLLLVCPSDVTFEVIPVRAFGSPGDLEAARALLRDNIRDRESSPAAFAVIPTAALAPPAETRP